MNNIRDIWSSNSEVNQVSYKFFLKESCIQVEDKELHRQVRYHLEEKIEHWVKEECVQFYNQ